MRSPNLHPLPLPPILADWKLLKEEAECRLHSAHRAAGRGVTCSRCVMKKHTPQKGNKTQRHPGAQQGPKMRGMGAVGNWRAASALGGGGGGGLPQAPAGCTHSTSSDIQGVHTCTQPRIQECGGSWDAKGCWCQAQSLPPCQAAHPSPSHCEGPTLSSQPTWTGDICSVLPTAQGHL